MISEHRRDRLLSSAFFLLASGLVIVSVGCGNRSTVAPKNSAQENKQDTIAEAQRRLETDSSPSTCLEILQKIDSATMSREDRPSPAPEKVAAAAALLQMTKSEAEAIGEKQFSSLDADYLSSCLLFRDAVRALEITEYSPETQATLAFAWVCRQIYLSDQYYPIAPPWWVLEAGSGAGYDRACVFLEMLRQLRLDGCLIGPPELAESPTRFPDRKQGGIRFAPVRAVGVRIGGDILLFDPWLGNPIRGDDGKKIATFAQARSNPNEIRKWLASSSFESAEAKRWEVFLAPPLSSVAPRMEWLQGQLSTGNARALDAVVLYVDAPALLERFKKEAMAGEALKNVNCRIWAPPDFNSPGPSPDPRSPSRVLELFHREVKAPDGSPSNRSKSEFKESHFPRQFIPNLQIDGQPLGGMPFRFIQSIFRFQFVDVLLAPGSSRDRLLHGQYNSAAAALTELKERNDTLYQGLAPEKSLQGAVKEWAQRANEVFADTQRAKEGGDPSALAKAQAVEKAFENSPLTVNVVHIVLRRTTRLLSAEAAYQLALVFHEKAERAHAPFGHLPETERKQSASSAWLDASGKWNEYLNNYPDLREFYGDRNRHARRMLSRCKEFLNDVR